MKFTNAFLFFVIFCSTNIWSQVNIGEDPTDAPMDKTVVQDQDERTITPSEKKIIYDKDDREKVLAVLKKIYPEKNFKDLNIELSKYLEAGGITLSIDENLELSELLSKEPDQSFIDKIKDFAFGFGSNNSMGVFDGIDHLRATFAENPLSLVPKEQIKETLLSQWEGKPMGKVFKEYPKVLEFFAALMVDKKAVPKLLDIFIKKNELKYFTILVVLSQVMCLLAFFTLFKNSSWLGRVFKRMLLMLGVNAVLLIYFVWRFYPEVSPTLGIVHQSFFS